MLLGSVASPEPLLDLLGELVCEILKSSNRRWKGTRPTERATEREVEAQFQRQAEAALVAHLLGTTDFKLVS